MFLLTGDVGGTDEEWFDVVCSVMESSNFLDRFVKDKILKRRSPGKKTRKPYENHNRTKDLWQTVWGQMLQDASLAVEGSWINRKFRRRFRIPYSMFLEVVKECKEHNVFGIISSSYTISYHPLRLYTISSSSSSSEAS